MSRFLRWTAAVAAALLVAGCGGGSSGGGPDEGKGTNPAKKTGQASGPASPSSVDLPFSLTSQRLDWHRCKATRDSAAPSDDWRCATL